MKVAQVIDRYLSLHPSEMDCLARGLINYSKLSRKICREAGISNFDAALVACRRYAARLQPKKSKDVLSKAKINVKVEKGSAVISLKLKYSSNKALPYLSALFTENDIDIVSSRSAKSSIMFKIKSKDIDKAMGLMKG